MRPNPRLHYELSHMRELPPAPRGKSLIIHIVVNIEHWRFDRPIPRKLLTAPHGVEKVPDVPNYSWAEYGMRVGMSRLLNALQERGIPASASINAGVLDAYPACAKAVLDAGWEFIGHGFHQQSMQAEDAAAERDLIQNSIRHIEDFTGQKVRGWLSPGLKESYDTPDHLTAAGIDYVCDWPVDDAPCWLDTVHRPLLAMPYNLELNDSVIYAVEKHSSSEILTRLEDTLDCFASELEQGRPKVLGIGLHPHLIGVAHRFPYFERMLDLLQSREDSIFMTGSQIFDWFNNHEY
ncbi:polysaccharide deacetylase family protein [Marinobacterium arenosum]|uniref:polysaccharide deacetylase family protein n=1 Tax=Marinobacterium arenosum TaxID=2862496 RepID=UPI001C97CBF2|nr:polysaccharide deacetylase family protein [Marinobacterium arenosum]MBY4677125.1 polysaccharide deacetylase family protein [Marinobacterium arenosum]